MSSSGHRAMAMAMDHRIIGPDQPDHQIVIGPSDQVSRLSLGPRASGQHPGLGLGLGLGLVGLRPRPQPQPSAAQRPGLVTCDLT